MFGILGSLIAQLVYRRNRFEMAIATGERFSPKAALARTAGYASFQRMHFTEDIMYPLTRIDCETIDGETIVSPRGLRVRVSILPACTCTLVVYTHAQVKFHVRSKSQKILI